MFASVFGLALAEGIKDMLFSTGFGSIETLAKTQPGELAAILGIDLYLARLIYLAAKKHKLAQDLQSDINQEETVAPQENASTIHELTAGVQVATQNSSAV